MSIFKRKTRLQRESAERERLLSPDSQNGLWADLKVFLFRLLPGYFGSLILLLIMWVILSNAVGASLGLSNIFRDRPDVQNAYNGANWNSPTFWTSAIILFACCLMLVFPALEAELEASEARLEDRKISRRNGRLFFLIGTPLLYLWLVWTWLRADTSAPVDGEMLRVAYGFVAGAVVFALCFQFGRSLRSVVLWLNAKWHDGKVDKAEADAYKGLLEPSVRSVMPTRMLRQGRSDARQFRRAMRNRLMSRETGLKLAFVAPMLIVIGAAFFAGNLIPAVALLSLILFLFLATKLMWVLPLAWRGAVFWLAIIAAVGLSFVDVAPSQTGRDTFKHAFDGIRDQTGADHYDVALQLDTASRLPEDCALEGSARAIQFGDTLKAWHARQERLTGETRPKLVFIATSGGAYRASYWTTLVMDRLVQANANPQLAGIADSVRLITGASGGMVGAAYFAALATDNAKMASQANITQALSRDILISQIADRTRERPAFYTTRYPVPRDSLSGVAQHLLQSDLASIFTAGLEPDDRGKVLENHWRELAVPMASFAQGETEGWRPSIIFSPMIVETGQQLLISNLDLGLLPSVQQGEAVDMFQWFPCARDTFRLNTAVRMNATFPFISPAVSLPTTPKRRIVDAGYYDNYGVSLLNALMSQSSAQCASYDATKQAVENGPFCLREWVRENTSGILLLEIRAFGLGTEGELGTACAPVPSSSSGHAFEFLTTPVEAVLAARSRAMVFQNEQGRRRITQMDADLQLDRVVFAHCSDGSMNWIVPPDEFEEMQAAVETQWNENEARLIAAWNSDDRQE